MNTKQLVALTLVIVTALATVPLAKATVGMGDKGILVKEWSSDMHWYAWGWFGSSPGIADLGPDVNTLGGEPNSNLEIVTGSDELWGPPGVPASAGVWRAFDSAGNLEWQRGTQTDEARSSPVIADINGDGYLEIAGGTTSGWYVQVMDRKGNFIWTFPKLTGFYVGGPFEWPSSPAVANLNPSVSGLELVIGNRPLGNVWAFDGDNSDGINDGITIGAADYPGWPWALGTEGTDWDVLWKFPATGNLGDIFATPAIGDVDNDGHLEVVIGAPDKNVYVLDGASGTVEHTFATGGAVYASAALADLDGDGYLEIVVGSTDGKIYAFQWDGTTGSTEWTYTTGGAVYSSAAIGDVNGDGSLEIVVGSNDGKVYSLDKSGNLKWSHTTGGAVYSSPALANRGNNKYAIEWQMFRHDARRTGFYGPSNGGLDIYVGSDDGYLYLLSGYDGSMIDRFEVYKSWFGGIHTSPSVADVDGDKKLEIFFYDWGQGSIYEGHTFWSIEKSLIDEKDFRFTDVNFVPMDPGPDGILGTADDIKLPAQLGDLLPDADGDGKYDVKYVLKPKDGTVSSTNPGQLYGVKTIKGAVVDVVHIEDTFGTQFDVNPAKLGGGVEVIRVNPAGLATVLTDTPQITSASVDNLDNKVTVDIDLDTPLGADTLMVYIKFETVLKGQPPNFNDFKNHNEVKVSGVTAATADATIEFV